jgi:hypothetical protein
MVVAGCHSLIFLEHKDCISITELTRIRREVRKKNNSLSFYILRSIIHVSSYPCYLYSIKCEDTIRTNVTIYRVITGRLICKNISSHLVQITIHWLQMAKLTRCEADHSLPCSDKVKHAWGYVACIAFSMMACCLNKHGGKYTFTLYFL